MKKRIFTLAMVIFVLAAAMLLTGCSEEPTPANRNTSSPNKTDDNSDRDFLSDPTAPTLGDTIVFDNLEITLGSSLVGMRLDNGSFDSFHGRQIFAVQMTIKNLKNESHRLDSGFITQFGPRGTELELDQQYLSRWLNDNISDIGSMRTGVTQTGYLHFLYDGDGEYVMEFSRTLVEPVTVLFTVTTDGNNYIGNKNSSGTTPGSSGGTGSEPSNHDDAYNIAQAWLDAHPAMGATISGGSNDLYQANGEEYYMFYLGEMYWIDILVHSKTGALFGRQTEDGENPGPPVIEPLDDYYNRFFR